MLKRHDPKTKTPLGEGFIGDGESQECTDILYYRDFMVEDSEWRWDNPEAAGVIESVVAGLSFGLIHYTGSRTQYFRELFYREQWIENTCSPGEQKDYKCELTKVTDWHDKYHPYALEGWYEPGTHEGGNLHWVWGQDVTDFGGGSLTISTGQLYIHGDGTISSNPEEPKPSGQDPGSSQPEVTTQGSSPVQPTPDEYGPEMTPIFMLGYDDVQGLTDKLNYLSTRGGLPSEVLPNSVLRGSDIINLYKSAYINGSMFGAVHIDQNKLYKVERMEFNQRSKKIIDDSNLIPVPVKYGYWALYLREKEN